MVKHDPGLCADVLHLANESSNKTKNIETIDEAFQYLGTQPLIQLIRYSFARNTISKHFKGLKYLQQYYIHSQKISESCRALAGISGISANDQELYATAGLIHDIGLFSQRQV
jgi:HD-like signal output (HDOD) protein